MRGGLLFALAAVWVGVAQQQTTPPITSGVQIVEVDARVFDKDGRFVSDLALEDFELLENGTAQTIDAVYLIGDRQASPAPVTTPGTVSGGLGSAAPARPAAAQTWVFFFDLEHLSAGGMFERARQAVEAFLATSFKTGDFGGIVAGDKIVHNRLTTVREELLSGIKSVKPRGDSRTRFLELSREWPRLLNEEEAIRIARNEPEWINRAVIRACSDDPLQCNVADVEVRQKGVKLAGEIQRASVSTLTALNGLASGLARIPGPKTVVFLSDGFVAQDVEGTLRNVVGQAARAGARVYAIDLRGLDRSGQGNLVSQAIVEDPAGPAIKTDAVADGPNSLAVDTGGLMIRNENDFNRALARIADDAGRYYVLAYRPANANFDGKIREITLRVKRDGVRVRARKGYLALPPSRMLLPQPVTAPSASPRTDQIASESAPPVSPGSGPPAEPERPTTATGAVIRSTGVETPAGGVRLRPDVEDRVRALSEHGGDAPSSELVSKGWEAYQRGDLEKAEVALSQAAAQPGVRPWVLYALGMSQVARGRVNEAIESWERVRNAAPDFEPVYLDLADAYAATSDMSAALAVVRDAQRRWPQSSDVLNAIGVIHVRRGALDEGIEALEQVTVLTPNDALAHLNLGRAYALRYHRGRRYVTSQRRWIAPEGDRRKAMDAFRRCVEAGGFYAKYASEELSLLEWSR